MIINCHHHQLSSSTFIIINCHHHQLSSSSINCQSDSLGRIKLNLLPPSKAPTAGKYPPFLNSSLLKATCISSSFSEQSNSPFMESNLIVTLSPGPNPRLKVTSVCASLTDPFVPFLSFPVEKKANPSLISEKARLTLGILAWRMTPILKQVPLSIQTVHTQTLLGPRSTLPQVFLQKPTELVTETQLWAPLQRTSLLDKSLSQVKQMNCGSIIISGLSMKSNIILKMSHDLSVEVVNRPVQTKERQDSQSNQFLESQGPRKMGLDVREEQEQEQEEPVYRIDQLLPKQSQRERLIEQNIKLKTQIYELAKQLDQILMKDRSKKKKYGMGLGEGEGDESEVVRDKRLELKRQQIGIVELKSKIFVAKRQLESVYNHSVIQAKEDELKNLKMELRLLEDEHQGLVNIKKVQVRALKVVRNEEEYGEKMTKVRQEYNSLKAATKLLIERISVAEKALMKTHEAFIIKLERIKDVEQKLALNKEKGKNRKPQPAVTQQMILDLQAELKELQLEKKEAEKAWQDKIKAVDTELQQRRSEEERKLMILREKEKESRINELRIRELRKLVKLGEEGGAVQSARRSTQDMDMSQYRHKRNIRYIEK